MPMLEPSQEVTPSYAPDTMSITVYYSQLGSSWRAHLHRNFRGAIPNCKGSRYGKGFKKYQVDDGRLSFSLRTFHQSPAMSERNILAMRIGGGKESCYVTQSVHTMFSSNTSRVSIADHSLSAGEMHQEGLLPRKWALFSSLAL